ncbi:MAG TPA: hypothetical protein VM686_05875 [Polyangiaceae bacterium]|jgi:hypothetical protein|nr:hypothetical protein [Polyangiaceae bacterium]
MKLFALLARLDERVLALGIILSSPFLRADGCGGGKQCNDRKAIQESYQVTHNTCGETGKLTLTSGAGSCSLQAASPAALNLPTSGNRYKDRLSEPGWYLYGRHENSPLRCTASVPGADKVRLDCRSEAGFSCAADLELLK